MDPHNLTEGFRLMFLGMGAVLLSLLSIQILITLLAWIVAKIHPVSGPEEKKTISGLTDEELTVVTAAVHTIFSGRAMIRHVRLLRETSQEEWSRQGRIDIMHSHTPGAGKPR